MTGDATIDAIRVFVALIALAGLAALVVRRLAIPYTVTLVVIGLLAGTILPAGAIQVGPQLVLLVLVMWGLWKARHRWEKGAALVVGSLERPALALGAFAARHQQLRQADHQRSCQRQLQRCGQPQHQDQFRLCRHRQCRRQQRLALRWHGDRHHQ